MKAEEASLYQAMKNKESEMVQHATKEHREIEKVLGEIEGSSGESFTSKIAELTGIINDHVKDEEEEMIPQARHMFDEGKID